ncbi:MAG: FapA family protein [Leptospirales bacterium]|nr:FapA family protein [Leptospirales bacterium]
MDRLKELLLGAEQPDAAVVNDRVEVVGLSIASCLNRAAEFLRTDLANLDYEILERGKRSLLNQTPYRLEVAVLPPEDRFADLEEFSAKLGVGDRLMSEALEQYIQPKHLDGRAIVRNYRSGVFLIVYSPLGEGRAVELSAVLQRIQQAGCQNFDQARVEETIREGLGQPIKIANYMPRPELDSNLKVDISPDEMKAFVRITAPRPGGRHLETSDVVAALRAHGVVLGFKETEIEAALLDDRYMQDILVAEGQPAKHGADARIDYKVKVRREGVNYEEDAHGKVDYKQMNLVENVVVGQILAEKLPATRGTIGKTIFNRLVEARDGKDIELRQGRGTILSEDRTKLIAEINGQVVYSNNRISVEPIFRIVGDVGPKTGNIMFLGSVVVGGSVLDNYEVKAAGNIEIGGSVQKCKLEAEGEIVVRGGILGARIESTGGDVQGKFIQNAEIYAAGDVTAAEGMMHSKVESGGSVYCNGRRAQIVGGSVRARKEIRARLIGSTAGTATEIVVGVDPRVLSQYEELKAMAAENDDKLSKTRKTVATLKARQTADPDGFAEEQAELLEKSEHGIDKMERKQQEIAEELLKLEEFMKQLSAEGKVHAEKELFPGVTISIRDAVFNVGDVYRAVTLAYEVSGERGLIKPGKLEKAQKPDAHHHGR